MRIHSLLRKSFLRTQSPNNPIIISPIEGQDSLWTGPADLSVGRLVRQTGEDLIGLADASLSTTVNAIGFVATKTGLTYTVRSAGELDAFEDLIPGEEYYVSIISGAIWYPESEEAEWPPWVLKVGTAKNATTLTIAIGKTPPIEY